MSENNDGAFERWGEDFDPSQIEMDAMAEVVVPMYLAFKNKGLSGQESAALTAALIGQSMPLAPQKPLED